MSYQANVYRKQGATEMTIDSGGLLNITSGAVALPANLKTGFIPLDLFAARFIASGETINGVTVTASTPLANAIGGLLHGGSTPILKAFSSGTSGMLCLEWASGDMSEIRWSPMPIPPDFDSSSPLYVCWTGNRGSESASNNTFRVQFFNSTNTTNVGTTGATMTTQPTEQRICVSATGLTAHPGFWNVGLKPITHTHNPNRIFAAGIEYTRRTS